MVVGICKIELHLPENSSLKEKRHISKNIIDQTKNNFNVSIAEVDFNDLWQRLCLGIACVANDNTQANKILSKVVNFIENRFLQFPIIKYEIEIL